MKTQETYKKVFINGNVENLPKKEGRDCSIMVFVGRKNNPLGCARYYFDTDEWADEGFAIVDPEWWLDVLPIQEQPVEMPTQRNLSKEDDKPAKDNSK